MNMLKIGRVNSVSSINFFKHCFLFLKNKETLPHHLPHKHVQGICEILNAAPYMYISKKW